MFDGDAPLSTAALGRHVLTLRGRPLEAAIRPLRAALDWIECVYREPISAATWEDLTKAADQQEIRRLVVEGGDVPLEVSRRGSHVVLECSGLRVAILDPEVAARSSRRTVNHVELQVQGAMFSTTRKGGEEIALAIYDAVNAALYADRGASAAERREALRSATRPGAWHVAVDLEVAGTQADVWIQEGLFASGSHDGFCDAFSTHARTTRTVSRRRSSPSSAHHRGMVERNAVRGRSGYIGAGTVELCLYERSKHVAGDWRILKPTLSTCGWDGQARVIRWEGRCRRTWFRDQEVVFGDRSVRGQDLTFEDFLRAFPGLAATLARRFRHTATDLENRRRRERRSSALQVAVERAVAGLADAQRSAPLLVAVTAVRRVAAAEHAVQRGRTALADFVAVAGVPSAEGAQRVLDAYEDPRWGEARERRQERQMQRYGIVDAPPLGGVATRGSS